MLIKVNNNTYEISKESFWHLAPKDSFFTNVFYNNISCGEGVIFSASFVAGMIPSPDAIHSPYSLGKSDDRKEKVFEDIRTEHYPSKPSRLKSLFVFDSKELAEKAKDLWFRNEKRKLHECKIVLNYSRAHRADSCWLDCNEEQWLEFSHKYWSGEMSTDSFPEVFVDGALYFPEWKELPRLQG